MLRVYGCIADHHDIRLVVVAVLVCFFASYSAFSLVARARQPARISTYQWLAAAAVVTGCGIWATHFVAMLGFQPGLPIGYDIALTALSAFIAVVASGLGYFVAVRTGYAALGGAVIGAAISAMHYVGMAAVNAQAQLHWDAGLVAASLVLGMGLGAVSLDTARRFSGWRGQVSGAFLFALGICAMHFTGMAALGFTPDGAVAAPEETVSPLWFAVAITAITILIVGLGLIGALVDKHVTEIERTKRKLEVATDELAGALEAANDANRSKSCFLATMSHELRTPLNAVIGFSEIMKDEMFGPVGGERYRDYAEDIFSSATHLLGLINDVLDLSRLDASHLALTEDAIDLDELVRDCIRLERIQADNANVTMLVHVAEGLPLVRGDVRRLRQVMINLICNAIKFTPAGGSICTSVLVRDGGLAIVIADTGIGIAESDIPKALQRFGQIDSAINRKYQGAGLGLPLSKQLVELHDGVFTLESALSVGTTVTVWFPPSRCVTLRSVIYPDRAAAAAG